jgi:hypothetical protein
VVFFSFVQGLIERYPELFGDEHGDSSQHQANFGRKWGSYTGIVSLANDDVTKFDDVVTQPLEKCLLLLAYRQDKVLLENIINNEMMAKMNHS